MALPIDRDQSGVGGKTVLGAHCRASRRGEVTRRVAMRQSEHATATVETGRGRPCPVRCDEAFEPHYLEGVSNPSANSRSPAA